MLTRSQVARRIGRSLATVRRLEGKELHPRSDARGVNRFDPGEVDALAERLMAAGSLSSASGTGREGDDEPWGQHSTREEELLGDIDRLRNQLGDAQDRARKAEWELDRFNSRAAEVLGRLVRELTELDTDLGAVVLEAMRELDE